MCPWPWRGLSRGGGTGGCGGQPCPGAVPGCVCAAGPGGGSGYFFLLLSFFPFFTSPPKYSASLSSGGRGGSARLLGGAGALLCTHRVLLGTGRAGRGVGMLRLPALAALVSAGRGWPGRCQPRQRGPPASLLEGSQGRIQPPRALLWWESGPGLGRGSLPRFPLIFTLPGLLCILHGHLSWDLPREGRWVPGDLQHPLRGGTNPKPDKRSGSKRGSTDLSLGLHLLPVCFHLQR